MDSAREAVGWLERHATYTRTGHHSARTGEWRDGDGLVASLFLHHLSRDGDPQLHVHVAIWNRVQRADGADGKWRTLDSRTLHNQRLGVAPVADRILETRLTALGYAMVPRADGNGAEVGGVSQDVMDLFSSRAVAVTGELKRLAQEYAGQARQAAEPPDAVAAAPAGRAEHPPHQGRGPPHHRRADRHRRTHRGAAARRLGSTDRAARSARPVRGARAGRPVRHESAPRRAPAVLDDAAKRTAARIAVAEVQRHHAVWSMAQLRFEVHRALPVLQPAATARRWSPRWPSWPSAAGPAPTSSRSPPRTSPT